MTKEKFSGGRAISIPNQPAISCRKGSCAPSANSRVCGDIWPGRIIGPESSETIMPAAMKLNMMVVITTWLPR